MSGLATLGSSDLFIMIIFVATGGGSGRSRWAAKGLGGGSHGQWRGTAYAG
jgi:hypothetical protein